MVNDEPPTEPPADGLTASQRIALAMGRPMPRRLTEDELRAFDAAMDKADAEVEEFYKNHLGESAA